MRDRLEESPVIVLQETASVSNSVGTEGQQKERSLSSIATVSSALPSIHISHPVPYPQRLAWAKLFHLEPKFARFLDELKRLYADSPFLEALKNGPSSL